MVTCKRQRKSNVRVSVFEVFKPIRLTGHCGRVLSHRAVRQPLITVNPDGNVVIFEPVNDIQHVLLVHRFTLSAIRTATSAALMLLNIVDGANGIVKQQPFNAALYDVRLAQAHCNIFTQPVGQSLLVADKQYNAQFCASILPSRSSSIAFSCSTQQKMMFSYSEQRMKLPSR